MTRLPCFALVVSTVLFPVIAFCFNAKIVRDGDRQYIVNPDNHLLYKNKGEKAWTLFDPLANIQVTAISIGGFDEEKQHLVLDTDGHVWAWGANNTGQLGLSDTVDRQAPTMIPNMFNIVGIETDSHISFLWDRDGNLWGFGAKWFQALQGLGKVDHHPTPQKIPHLPPIRDLKTEGIFVVALSMDGSVWVWGNNRSGQIGCGDAQEVDVPRSIGEIPPIIQISTGSNISFLLDEQNQIWVAGKMHKVQDGPMENNVDFGNTYQRFYDLRAKEIAISSYSIAAIDLDNTLVIWGLAGKRDYDWEFIETPRRIEQIKARSVFFFGGNLYVITLKNKIEKYRHQYEDELEVYSAIICGNPITTVKKSYRD